MQIPLLSVAAAASGLAGGLIRAALSRVEGRESADTAKPAHYLGQAHLMER
jgi:hypothetical protein